MIDLAGRVFGRLTVMGLHPERYRGQPRWVCVCSCGTVKIIRASNLQGGSIVSCGCLKRERASAWKGQSRKHGDAADGKRTPEYTCWTNMKLRCANPRAQKYAWYGARGITVDPRWTESFAAFLADVGRRPGAGYSIDRIDNDGNYEPGNVRWATRSEQARNQHRGKRKATGHASNAAGS